ncbi:MAG: EamA family transporter [Lachnospiraceae bacterium]|nr:EamA family transporter [Lachnospiraceae bacterium]
MGYFYIFTAVLCNTAKGYSSKRVSGTMQTIRESIVFNIARSFVCCIFAFLFVLLKRVPDVFSFTAFEIVICLISGISMAVFTTVWILALKSDAYMLVSACGSASFIVPCICGLFFLNESFTPFKFVAFVLILCALRFLLKYNFKLNGNLSKRQVFLLVLIVISQGITQTTQKLYAIYIPEKDIGCYTLYMLFISFLAFLPILPFFKKDEAKEKYQVIRHNIKYILIMGLALFASSYFQTLAAKDIDAIILYPLLNALNLIGGSTIAALIFKEKLSRDSVSGIILVFWALVLSRF